MGWRAVPALRALRRLAAAATPQGMGAMTPADAARARGASGGEKLRGGGGGGGSLHALAGGAEAEAPPPHRGALEKRGGGTSLFGRTAWSERYFVLEVSREI